jgi:hypothetical protein
MVMGPDGAQNQDILCWREPTTIYPTDQLESPPLERKWPIVVSPTPLVEEAAPLLNTYISRRKQKPSSWIPTRLETKNYCAGETQQQFNRPTDRPTKLVS